jgi:hypothetical protein
MNRKVGFTAVAVALLCILLLGSQPAAAWDWGCTSNASCSVGTTCQTVWSIFGVTYRTCKAPPLCNADSECRGGGRCINGVCQAAAPPAPPSGPGTGIPGEGRKCMPRDGSKPPDWARDEHGKPLGACPQGTFCNDQGYCRKLEQ